MKKGFTLIELLAVIVLLSIIITIVSISVVPAFNSSKNKLNEIQKKEIEDAVKLYIQDYCINPFEDNNCDFTISYNSGIPYVSSGSMSLNTLSSYGYFDKDECSGNIIINNGVINLDEVSCNL